MNTLETLAKKHRRKLTVTFGRTFENGSSEYKFMVLDKDEKVAGLGKTTEDASKVLLDILQRRRLIR